MKIDKEIKKRFWAGVEKTDYCWNWIRANRGNGYGCMRIKKKTYNTHRISWIIHYVDIPKELCVLHKCDNRKCIRPDHLFLGTKAENNKDMAAKGRSARGEKHGTRKHPESVLKGENHYYAKLTEKEVLEIRRIWDENKGKITKYELARIFKTDERNIRGILKRIFWKHI